MIEWGKADWRETRGRTASVSIAAVKNPIAVTAPRRIYCQGANDRQHMLESEMDPICQA
jgi:hypothetical protein